MGIPVLIAMFSIGINGEQAILANIIELVVFNLLGGFLTARKIPSNYKIPSMFIGTGTLIWLIIMYAFGAVNPKFGFVENPLIIILVLPLALVSFIGGWLGSKFPMKPRKIKQKQLNVEPTLDDYKAITSDWQMVGKDINGAIREWEKQSLYPSKKPKPNKKHK